MAWGNVIPFVFSWVKRCPFDCDVSSLWVSCLSQLQPCALHERFRQIHATFSWFCLFMCYKVTHWASMVSSLQSKSGSWRKKAEFPNCLPPCMAWGAASGFKNKAMQMFFVCETPGTQTESPGFFPRRLPSVKEERKTDRQTDRQKERKKRKTKQTTRWRRRRRRRRRTSNTTTTTTTLTTTMANLLDFSSNMANLPDIGSQAFKAMDSKPTGLWHKSRDGKPNTDTWSLPGCIASFAKHNNILISFFTLHPQLSKEEWRNSTTGLRRGAGSFLMPCMLKHRRWRKRSRLLKPH